jgi:hypothetical protein
MAGKIQRHETRMADRAAIFVVVDRAKASAANTGAPLGDWLFVEAGL